MVEEADYLVVDSPGGHPFQCEPVGGTCRLRRSFGADDGGEEPPLPSEPLAPDAVRLDTSLLVDIRNEMEWREAPDLLSWLESSRLNLMRGLDQDPRQTSVAALQGRFLTALFPALSKLEKLASNATPAERAWMFEPAADAAT